MLYQTSPLIHPSWIRLLNSCTPSTACDTSTNYSPLPAALVSRLVSLNALKMLVIGIKLHSIILSWPLHCLIRGCLTQRWWWYYIWDSEKQNRKESRAWKKCCCYSWQFSFVQAGVWASRLQECSSYLKAVMGQNQHRAGISAIFSSWLSPLSTSRSVPLSFIYP